MSAPLVPLTRPMVIAGRELTFPLQPDVEWFLSGVVPASRRRVAALAGPPVRPAPVGNRRGSLAFTVCLLREEGRAYHLLVVWAPGFLGFGSPVPGLAAALHASADHARAVGDFGFTPLWVLSDDELAARTWGELWQVPHTRLDIRYATSGPDHLVEVHHRGQALLRLLLTPTSDQPARAGRLTMAVRRTSSGRLWHDSVEVWGRRVVRRWGRGCGSVDLYAAGRLTGFAAALGATDTHPFHARAYTAVLLEDGQARVAGPRSYEP